MQVYHKDRSTQTIVRAATLQGCHWTFAKITENLLTEEEHKKRQTVQKEKDETGENREY